MNVDFPVVDFPVKDTVRVGTADELRAALVSHDAIRLAGTGSAQRRIPAPDGEVTIVSTADMNRILRLEADDLTCSVEPGVRREDLDRELAEVGLWLPCAGTGTVGGIFAADEHGPQGPAQPEPRGLLLGVTGLLPEGRRFRAGARVVKNVAGFDIQKLFVGSRGRLFAVTELHLKLRPRPRSTLHFANRGLERSAALELAAELRRQPTRPSSLVVESNGSCAVRGSLAGNARHLDRLAADLGLQRTDGAPAGLPADIPADIPADSPAGDGELETVRGQIRFRRVGELLEHLPGDARFLHNGERFIVRLPSAATDALLAHLPSLGAIGEITTGAPDRRGRATPIDPACSRLADELERALDPRGVLR